MTFLSFFAMLPRYLLSSRRWFRHLHEARWKLENGTEHNSCLELHRIVVYVRDWYDKVKCK